jgi:hypothetical protein
MSVPGRVYHRRTAATCSLVQLTYAGEIQILRRVREVKLDRLISPQASPLNSPLTAVSLPTAFTPAEERDFWSSNKLPHCLL